MNTLILTLKSALHMGDQPTKKLVEVDQVVEKDSDDEQNENDDGVPVEKAETKEVRKAAQILKDFTVFTTIFHAYFHNLAKRC